MRNLYSELILRIRILAKQIRAINVHATNLELAPQVFGAMSEWSAISDLARIIAVLNARPDGLPIDAEYREPLSPMLP
jgi:hypothetical protein